MYIRNAMFDPHGKGTGSLMCLVITKHSVDATAYYQMLTMKSVILPYFSLHRGSLLKNDRVETGRKRLFLSCSRDAEFLEAERSMAK